MAKYLISFPSGVMDVPAGGLAEVSATSHAAIQDAKDAGVYVFGGGIDESVPPVLVNAAGEVASDTYPRTAGLNGGFLVLELPTRDDAVRWAARIAEACRCAQELQVFGYDPDS